MHVASLERLLWAPVYNLGRFWQVPGTIEFQKSADRRTFDCQSQMVKGKMD